MIERGQVRGYGGIWRGSEVDHGDSDHIDAAIGRLGGMSWLKCMHLA